MTQKSILHSIRILDFTRVLAGPYATRLLADFGAEVIKVNYTHTPLENDKFSRGYYYTWNRNKRGITLDLNKPEGLAIAKKLVSISDAVVENFAPRVMANWGLDYPNLKLIKPDIIMLSMSVMGQTGPLRDYIGFGPTVQAFSGITSLTAYPGSPPVGPGFSYADHIAGLFGCITLLNALEYRRKTGAGQHIDLSEVESMAYLLGDAIVEYTLKGVEPQPAGNAGQQACPHGVYRCQGEDRWCAIAVFTDEHWSALKQCLGNPSWSEERQFATLMDRLKNAPALDALIESWTKQHTAEEVMAVLQSKGVPAGVVQNAADIARDPQLRARGFLVEMAHPEMEKTISDAAPVKLSATPAQYTRPAPTPGQDNDYVYKGLLGMTEQELAELKKKGVI